MKKLKNNIVLKVLKKKLSVNLKTINRADAQNQKAKEEPCR